MYGLNSLTTYLVLKNVLKYHITLRNCENLKILCCKVIDEIEDEKAFILFLKTQDKPIIDLFCSCDSLIKSNIDK